MNQQDFLTVLSSVRRIDGHAMLDVPIRDTTLDSLDLATLRSALEARIGHPIRDDVWSRAGTLRQILECLE